MNNLVFHLIRTFHIGLFFWRCHMVLLPRGLISFTDHPHHQLEINLITNILSWTIGWLWIHHKILISTTTIASFGGVDIIYSNLSYSRVSNFHTIALWFSWSLGFILIISFNSHWFCFFELISNYFGQRWGSCKCVVIVLKSIFINRKMG